MTVELLTFGVHKMDLFEKIIDSQTGEETLRPYTKEEIAAVEKEIERLSTEQAIIDAEIAKKESARKAVLEKLGLTAEEAAILLT